MKNNIIKAGGKTSKHNLNSSTLDMDAISANAAGSGVFLAGLERDQSAVAAS